MTVGAAIEVVDLVKRFPQRRSWRALFAPAPGKLALDHVSIAIPAGEIFGLLGPNGAGKTTLIKILSTLVLPTSGRAVVAGLNVMEHSQEVRRRIGLVYGDERTFFLRLSVLENLRFYAALYHLPPQQAERRIWELLALVGLEDSAHLRMHHFSTGMRQRAAIARGLLTDPEILFMDEPTRGLDPVATRELQQLVQERVADGRRTVLLATNIMNEVEQLCHRVAFLNQGRIHFVGTVSQLRDTLQIEETHHLIVSNVSREVVEALRRVPGVRSLNVVPREDMTYLVKLGVQKESSAVPLAIRAIVQSDGYVWSSERHELSLDEIFIHLSSQRETHSTNGSVTPELVGRMS